MMDCRLIWTELLNRARRISGLISFEFILLWTKTLQKIQKKKKKKKLKLQKQTNNAQAQILCGSEGIFVLNMFSG